jgi:hypothetical protein
VDDKKRKWMVSSTVPKLEALIDELQSWHDEEEQDFKKLGLKAKPVAWAQPGMLKKMTVDNLLAVDHKYMTDQDTIKWLAFRSKIDKSRKNALTKIHDDMVGLAKQEKDT